MKEDRWIKAAFIDSNMVADLLLRLKQPPPPPSMSSFQAPSNIPPPPPPPFLPPLSWGQKQPRSTPARKYSPTTTTRCSPRTPLSWSGATASPSDGGCDEPSVGCTEPASSSRSKILSQLKEEETQLLKERVTLKRDLKSIHVNLKKQRNRRDDFRKMKCNLNQQSTERGALSIAPEVLIPNHSSEMEASRANHHQSILPRYGIKKESATANTCGMREVTQTNKSGFFLPDLNMPLGDDDIAAELW